MAQELNITQKIGWVNVSSALPAKSKDKLVDHRAALASATLRRLRKVTINDMDPSLEQHVTTTDALANFRGSSWANDWFLSLPQPVTSRWVFSSHVSTRVALIFFKEHDLDILSWCSSSKNQTTRQPEWFSGFPEEGHWLETCRISIVACCSREGSARVDSKTARLNRKCFWLFLNFLFSSIGWAGRGGPAVQASNLARQLQSVSWLALGQGEAMSRSKAAVNQWPAFSLDKRNCLLPANICTFVTLDTLNSILWKKTDFQDEVNMSERVPLVAGCENAIFALSATPTTPTHTVQLGRCK